MSCRQKSPQHSILICRMRLRRSPAVTPFVVPDPVTETGTETQVTYSGRGVLARYKLRRIDGVNILHGDVKLTALVNEVTDKPAVGHIIIAPDPITGELQRYEIITASADSAGAAYSIQLRRA